MIGLELTTKPHPQKVVTIRPVRKLPRKAASTGLVFILPDSDIIALSPECLLKKKINDNCLTSQMLEVARSGYINKMFIKKHKRKIWEMKCP